MVVCLTRPVFSSYYLFWFKYSSKTTYLKEIDNSTSTTIDSIREKVIEYLYTYKDKIPERNPIIESKIWNEQDLSILRDDLQRNKEDSMLLKSKLKTTQDELIRLRDKLEKTELELKKSSNNSTFLLELKKTILLTKLRVFFS